LRNPAPQPCNLNIASFDSGDTFAVARDGQSLCGTAGQIFNGLVAGWRGDGLFVNEPTMERISSSSTFFYKKILPYAGPPLGVAALLSEQISGVLHGTKQLSPAAIVIALVFVAGGGFFL
jgi:hypothetical protein